MWTPKCWIETKLPRSCNWNNSPPILKKMKNIDRKWAQETFRRSYTFPMFLWMLLPEWMSILKRNVIFSSLVDSSSHQNSYFGSRNFVCDTWRRSIRTDSFLWKFKYSGSTCTYTILKYFFLKLHVLRFQNLTPFSVRSCTVSMSLRKYFVWIKG